MPWRDAGTLRPGVPFTVEGYTPADGEENPRARFRIVAPRFFAVLGVPLLAGRDFTDEDRAGSEPVAIVSQSVAQRLFPNGDALNRHMWWTDPYFGPNPCRAASSASSPTWTTRTSCAAAGADDLSAGAADGCCRPPVRARRRRSVRARAGGDARHPRDLRRTSRWSARRRSRTCAREVLSPERLNAFVFSGFAGIALLIAVVGVAGVLAFSVSARTREFGVRLAVGSAPRQLLARVLSEGVRDCRDRHRGRRGGRLRARRASRRDSSGTCSCPAPCR